MTVKSKSKKEKPIVLPESVQKRLELWKKMKSGDMDALLTLSVESGLMTQDDADFIMASED